MLVSLYNKWQRLCQFQFMNIICISIGDELLMGQTMDTNSHWISQQFHSIGGKVVQKLTISDDKESILAALKFSVTLADVITITGGLGPTKDDITKQVLAEFFQCPLVMNEGVLNDVKQYFEKRNRPFNQLNEMQALVPKNCKVLRNPVGTAPGMLFEYNSCLIGSFPGVPYEMKHLMRTEFLPVVEHKFSTVQVNHAHFLTAGKGEIDIAQSISEFEDKLPEKISLAYLPSLGAVSLRLSAYNLNTSESILFQQLSDQLAVLLSEILISRTEGANLETAAFELLKRNKKTVGFAESCTGGLISYSFTKHPGISSVFKGAIVSYTNELKQQLLNVPSKYFSSVGAVSEEVVKEMVEGALTALNSDYAIGVSGVAGPSGGTLEKPVGTVWIAVGSQSNVKTIKMQFPGERTVVMERAKQQAFFMLIRLLKEDRINE